MHFQIPFLNRKLPKFKESKPSFTYYSKDPAPDNFLEIISSKSKKTLNLETHCIALRIYFILKKIELTLQ